MSRRSVLNVLFWAVSVGGLMAVLNGDQRAVSLRLWLACLVIWFAAASVRRLLEGVPLVPARFNPLFILRRRKPVVADSRLREVRAVEGLLLRARDNDRAFTQQLQPRIVALADHFLPVTHGIDRHTQPERARQVLGDLGWMIDLSTRHRTPTLQELDDLIELLIHPSGARTEEAV